MSSELWPHQPVLYHQVLDYLYPHSPGHYVDATIGAAGHAEGILERSSPAGLLLGLDLDPNAIEIAKRRLTKFGERCILRNANYARLEEILEDIGWQGIDGIIFDLGVSSMQIEIPFRGFSFLQDGPLDMRFDPTQITTAKDLVNELKEEELTKILWEYGEEPRARQIAVAICHARPLSTTRELSEIVISIYGDKRGRLHPATLTFQALRIAVNHELQSLKQGLEQSLHCLVKEGRLVVIAFHSLEDRLIKQFLVRESRDCICPPEQPVCTCDHKATLRIITRQVLKASSQEIQVNPRARSARLRVAEKTI